MMNQKQKQRFCFKNKYFLTPSLSKSIALIAPRLPWSEQYFRGWPEDDISHKWTILSLHPVANNDPDGWNWSAYTSNSVQS